MPPATKPGGEARLALGAGIACYLIWGFVPLYLQALGRMGVSPWETLVHRIVWSWPGDSVPTFVSTSQRVPLRIEEHAYWS